MNEVKVVRDLRPVLDQDFHDIIYEKNRETHVARVTINRPQTLNSLTGETMWEIASAINDAAADELIGVVLLTGAGDRAFSSGGDIHWEKSGIQSKFFQVDARIVHDAIRHCLKPVIAVVKGYAIGMGNHLAYCCDLTIAADNAVFGQNGPRVGSPAEGIIVSYSTFVVGQKRARELWMVCRKYSASEALAMGMCNAVVPLDQLDQEVDSWCAEILALSPSVLAGIKASFEVVADFLRDSDPGHWQRILKPGGYPVQELLEGQNAFLEKRPPDFWRFRS